MHTTFQRLDVVKLRRVDLGQPIDPRTGAVGELRYLDTAAAPIELRCQLTYSRRRRQQHGEGGQKQDAFAVIRYRRSDAAQVDDRTPPGLRPGDLVVAITKPKELGVDVYEEAVHLYVDDPRPASQGVLNPLEWLADLVVRRPETAPDAP